MRRIILALFLLVASGWPVFSQQTGLTQLKAADSLLANGDLGSALSTYQRIILDPMNKELYSRAYFGLIKTYFSLQDYPNTQKTIEYFLLNFPRDTMAPEVEYQKGRLLYNQGEFEKCIASLDSFLTKYPENPMVSNALFWMGDSAFNLGQLDQSRLFFLRIINGYPTSFKVEAARYRLALIDLKSREEELIKLLKWSHEEGVNALDEFQRREKGYQQALLALQKKVLDMQGTESGAAMAALEKQIREKDAIIKSLKTSGLPASAVAAATSEGSADNRQKLLEIKERALLMKEVYLSWMEKNGK